jgi:hypothetical protein
MDSLGACVDNAMMESFWTRVLELLNRRRWRTDWSPVAGVRLGDRGRIRRTAPVVAARLYRGHGSGGRQAARIGLVLAVHDDAHPMKSSPVTTMSTEPRIPTRLRPPGMPMPTSAPPATARPLRPVNISLSDVMRSPPECVVAVIARGRCLRRARSCRTKQQGCGIAPQRPCHGPWQPEAPRRPCLTAATRTPARNACRPLRAVLACNVATRHTVHATSAVRAGAWAAGMHGRARHGRAARTASRRCPAR